MEERLRKFARVVETSSFTRAASELHISQPALSIAIRKLEQELGSKLFIKRQPPLKLTEAGKAAYRYAKSLGARNSNFKLELAQLARQKPPLSIGMIDSLAYTLFVHSDSLTDLKKQAHISLSINNSRILSHQLLQGELDVALVAARHSDSFTQNIRIRSLGTEPLVAVTNPENAPLTKKSIKSGVLPDFLSYDQSSHTNLLVSRHFSGLGVELLHTFRSTSLEILLHMALQGEGTAVLPYVLVRQALADRKLVITAGPIARPIIALEHKEKETALPLLMLCKNIQQDLERLNREDGLVG